MTVPSTVFMSSSDKLALIYAMEQKLKSTYEPVVDEAFNAFNNQVIKISGMDNVPYKAPSTNSPIYMFNPSGMPYAGDKAFLNAFGDIRTDGRPFKITWKDKTIFVRPKYVGSPDGGSYVDSAIENLYSLIATPLLYGNYSKVNDPTIYQYNQNTPMANLGFIMRESIYGSTWSGRDLAPIDEFNYQPYIYFDKNSGQTLSNGNFRFAIPTTLNTTYQNFIKALDAYNAYLITIPDKVSYDITKFSAWPSSIASIVVTTANSALVQKMKEDYLKGLILSDIAEINKQTQQEVELQLAINNINNLVSQANAQNQNLQNDINVLKAQKEMAIIRNQKLRDMATMIFNTYGISA